MATSYHFCNLTRNETNKLPIPGFGEATFVNDLHELMGGKLIEIFKAIGLANNWAPNDVLEATSGSRWVTYVSGMFSWEAHGYETGDDFNPLPEQYPVEPYDGHDGYDSLDDPEIHEDYEEDYDW